MYMVKTYISPEDILDKLSEEDKKKGLNRCVCTNVVKDEYGGTVEMTYVLFKEDEVEYPKYNQYDCCRQSFFNDELEII